MEVSVLIGAAASTAMHPSTGRALQRGLLDCHAGSTLPSHAAPPAPKSPTESAARPRDKEGQCSRADERLRGQE